MGAFCSCFTGTHEETDEDDDARNQNSINPINHNRGIFFDFFNEYTRLWPTRRNLPSTNPEAPSIISNRAAENSVSDTIPLSVPASFQLVKKDGTATKQLGEGGKFTRSNIEGEPKKSRRLTFSNQKSEVGGFYACVPLDVDEDVCPTCLEEYTNENPKITAHCSHSFHLGCIYAWKERSEDCPMCRKLMIFNERA